MSATQELLSVNNLTRYFGSVPALVDVNFSIAPGEVLGVVGQRGSGKSTLFHLLAGAIQPTAGEIHVEGRRVGFRTPKDAQTYGIETVYQLPPVADNLSVMENVFLGRELARTRRLGILPRWGEMLVKARELFDALGMPPNLVFANPRNLSEEQRQLIALARAFCRPFRILLLDDALASLSFSRQQILLTRIQDLARQGVAIIVSSDDLNQIFRVSDRVLVLYQGTQVALRPASETTPREVVELIVGSNRQERVTPVIWAFENYHAAQQQAEELRLAQQSLRQSLEAQASLNRQLIQRLGDQLRALDHLNLALQEANRRLMTEREEERKALARELHDEVIQDLLSFNYQLEASESELADEGMSEDLAKIREGIRQVVSSLRQICSDLRPPTIDGHGLPAAIRSLAHQWSEQNGIQVQLNIDPGLGRLPEPIELSVFRIIQEGLRNVRKHANATRVRLSLQRTATASLAVKMSDNGQGVTQPINLASLSEEKHFGLVGISERVSLLGGTMQVKSPDNGGLELSIEIPSPYPSIQS